MFNRRERVQDRRNPRFSRTGGPNGEKRRKAITDRRNHLYFPYRDKEETVEIVKVGLVASVTITPKDCGLKVVTDTVKIGPDCKIEFELMPDSVQDLRIVEGINEKIAAALEDVKPGQTVVIKPEHSQVFVIGGGEPIHEIIVTERSGDTDG